MTSSLIHIAAFAFPFGTHAAPLLNLVRRLAKSTPSITFSFISTSKANASVFPTGNPVDFPNIKAYDIDDESPADGMDEILGMFLKAAPEKFKKGVKTAEKDSGLKVTGLLTDAFFWFSGEFAAEMGVPWMAFWTAGPLSLSVHMYTDRIRDIFGKDGNADANLKLIPGMSKVHKDDLMEGVISNLDSNFAQALHNMGRVMPKANAVIINSFEDLDFDTTTDLKKRLQNLLCVGPSILSSPPLPDESGIINWLDTQKHDSVVYISFGTVCTPPPNELLALAGALEESKTPFLWSIRDNKQNLLPKGFVEKTSKYGKIVHWAPQLQVLANSAVGIFVTHCGWNSVLESISFGVPMLCRPFFGDQMLNSALVENVWKIGVRADGRVFTKNGTLQAIKLLFSEDKGKEMRVNVNILKEQAAKAVGLNGVSTKNFETLTKLISST